MTISRKVCSSFSMGDPRSRQRRAPPAAATYNASPDPPRIVHAPMQPALAVSTSSELLHALQQLAQADFVAIDTEFMRESTYYPKLCLIQVATPQVCALIDPLTSMDLHPLWEFLAERARVKVLHAARQDIEVLSLSNEPAPGPIFDTQIAAALLGYSAQI